MTIKHLSAGIVTFRRENNEIYYLLLRYPQGHVEFPKGHVEPLDKNLKDTAIRELYEETGLVDPVFIESFYQEIEYDYHFKGEAHEKKVCFYLAEVFSQDVVCSHEHTELFWSNYDDAMSQVTFENAKNLLRSSKVLIDLYDETAQENS